MKYKLNRLLIVASAVAFPLFGGALSTNVSAGFWRDNFEQSQTKPKPEKPQQEDSQSSDDTPIRLGTDLVVLDVTVVDPSNSPVMDLARENFLATEDRLPPKIEFFSRDEVPVSVVFTLDTSGSMRPKLDSVSKACVSLVRESRKGDEVAVIAFKEQP